MVAERPDSWFWRRAGDHRVLLVTGPSNQVLVRGDGQAGKGRRSTQAGVEQVRRSVVHDRAAGPAAVTVGAVRVWLQRQRMICPVPQVGAAGMTPGDVL